MTNIENNTLSADEIVNVIESKYTDKQQALIVPILFRVEHTIDNSEILELMIKDGILQISKTPYTEYRLRKFFEKHSINKISEMKEFIFSKIPSYKGLKRGKNASYDDLVEYVNEKYPDLFVDCLDDIKIYEFTPLYKENGNICTLYFNRKLNPKARYKFDAKINQFVLKEDEATELLRKHNIKLDVENPSELYDITFDLTPSINKCMSKYTKVLPNKQIRTGGKLIFAAFLCTALSVFCILFLLPALVLFLVSLIYFIRATMTHKKEQGNKICKNQ